ncbi:DGQHR domain-containing protein [Priestia megaterium]
MHVKNCIHFKQIGVHMVMMTLSVKEIIDIYEVDIYNEVSNKEGYQRPPIPSHFKEIASYLTENSASIFLPSAIIGAVYKEKIAILEDGSVEIHEKIRIVDGQHRIKGFEYALFTQAKSGNEDSEIYQELSNFNLPIILMIVDNSRNERLKEITAFIDINSKGKKVSTDLAIILRNQMYDKTQDYLGTSEKLVEKISTDVSLSLTNSPNHHIWYKAIKTAPSDRNRIISINSFNNSISSIVAKFIEMGIPINSSADVTVLTEQITWLISNTWIAIHKKWPSCFSKTGGFNKKYNIQKGIGVHALHLLLADCVSEEIKDCNVESLKEFLTQVLNNFRYKINTSIVTADDWVSGKKFSGFNSSSGFQKVKYYIQNGKFPE